MSLFSFLFKNKNDTSNIKVKSELIVGNLNTKTSQLFKQATALKKQGNIDEAITILKQAHLSAKKENVTYDIKPFLRLPMYLLQAKRADEGWKELNRLIVEGYPQQNKNLAIVMMDHSAIYGKMRLFLQREKKNVDAVKFGIFSYLCWAKGLSLQKRNKELKLYIKNDVIDEVVSNLLKKAKLPEKKLEIVTHTQNEANALHKLDIATFSRKIDLIMKAG